MMNYLCLCLYYLIGKNLPSASFTKIGVKLRYLLVRGIFENVGKNVNIARNVSFGKGGIISIGDNSGIGEDSKLVSMGKIVIGNDVMIAPQVIILTGGHEYSDKTLLLREQPSVIKPVSIGNDSWIGARVTILPGVNIGERVIVAAGSVVTCDLESNGVYAGVPAKKIKSL
ncbi:acyltransferase [Vibrio cionasavignyae]|uniref:acyltransferase n=1 Tax=Vibrio cionasavignyae TaxID=2910252 RepID=UPI003D0AFEC2